MFVQIGPGANPEYYVVRFEDLLRLSQAAYRESERGFIKAIRTFISPPTEGDDTYRMLHETRIRIRIPSVQGRDIAMRARILNTDGHDCYVPPDTPCATIPIAAALDLIVTIDNVQKERVKEGRGRTFSKLAAAAQARLKTTLIRAAKVELRKYTIMVIGWYEDHRAREKRRAELIVSFPNAADHILEWSPEEDHVWRYIAAFEPTPVAPNANARPINLSQSYIVNFYGEEGWIDEEERVRLLAMSPRTFFGRFGQDTDDDVHAH